MSTAKTATPAPAATPAIELKGTSAAAAAAPSADFAAKYTRVRDSLFRQVEKLKEKFPTCTHETMVGEIIPAVMEAQARRGRDVTNEAKEKDTIELLEFYVLHMFGDTIPADIRMVTENLKTYISTNFDCFRKKYTFAVDLGKGKGCLSCVSDS